MLLAFQFIGATLLSILKRISFEEILNAAETVWVNRTTAKKVAQAAFEIITKTSKNKVTFFNGRSSKSILGGLFYLLGFRYSNVKTQKKIAAQLGTTDVTVRVTYRKWLEEFPDLFPDAIGKLSESGQYFSSNDDTQGHFKTRAHFEH